jgi:hypothetical protein
LGKQNLYHRRCKPFHAIKGENKKIQFKRIHHFLSETLFMYSRKQFFIETAKHCLYFVRKCIPIPSLIEEDHHKDSENHHQESLFFEAMLLGIDPGTMDMSQLACEVKLAKQQKEKGGGLPLKNTG